MFTMKVVLLFHLKALVHPDACALWQEKHVTSSLGAGPLKTLLLLLAWFARVEIILVASWYGTSELYGPGDVLGNIPLILPVIT